MAWISVLLAQIVGVWVNADKPITDNITLDAEQDMTADAESEALWDEFDALMDAAVPA